MFTLRELAWMAAARRMDEWDRASLVAAVVANVFRGKRSSAIKLDAFNPYRRRVAAKPLQLSKDQQRELMSGLFGGRR